MTPFLFVYGTLMPDAEGPTGTRQRIQLRDQGEVLGAASTRGHLFDLGAYPGFIHADGLVHGAVYRLLHPDETLIWLDAYEGVGGSSTDEYLREPLPVTLASGKSLTAWTYVFIGDPRGLCQIPSGRWQHRPS